MRIQITARITPSWRAAIERAAQHRTRGLVAVPVAPGVYSVPSAVTAERYEVRIINAPKLLASCTCPHGRHGTFGHCWHVCSALCREIERLATLASAA